jgi:hypothetical protein
LEKFKDSKGRTWTLAVNVDAIKRVRDELKVDLARQLADESERVYGDPCLLVDVLYVLCRDQCKARKVSDVEFGRAMAGDCLDQAANALAESVILFFPTTKRPTLRRLVEKGKQIAATLERATATAVEMIDPAKWNCFDSATK